MTPGTLQASAVALGVGSAVAVAVVVGLGVKVAAAVAVGVVVTVVVTLGVNGGVAVAVALGSIVSVGDRDAVGEADGVAIRGVWDGSAVDVAVAGGTGVPVTVGVNRADSPSSAQPAARTRRARRTVLTRAERRRRSPAPGSRPSVFSHIASNPGAGCTAGRS
jgi:hypothetical protein